MLPRSPLPAPPAPQRQAGGQDRCGPASRWSRKGRSSSRTRRAFPSTWAATNALPPTPTSSGMTLCQNRRRQVAPEACTTRWPNRSTWESPGRRKPPRRTAREPGDAAGARRRGDAGSEIQSPDGRRSGRPTTGCEVPPQGSIGVLEARRPRAAQRPRSRRRPGRAGARDQARTPDARRSTACCS